MTTITENRYTTIDARMDDEDWIIDTGVTVSVSGLGINASDDIAGRDFTIKGSLLTGNQPAIILGATAAFDAQSIVKVDMNGTMRSGVGGLVAHSGGVTFLNVGTVEAALVALDFEGDGNDVENDGNLTSTGSIAIRSAGVGDTIVNNGTLTSYADAIVSTGGDTEIANNLNLTARHGRGIVSSGAAADITNTGLLKSRLDGIVSSGDDAVINNYSTIESKTGAGILSSGDGATITTTTYIKASTVGISSTGDDAVITNTATVESAGTGIRSTGDNAEIYTSLTLIGKTALLIAGNGSSATNANDIYGTSRTAAAVRITSTDGAEFTNQGAVFARSGEAIEAGNGDDSIANTGSIHGHVRLGGGNDWFGALSGSVDGKVYGGRGDDVYEAGIKLRIVEKAGEGNDTVKANFSWTLGKNIENLELTGSAAANGVGNRLANILTGNEGDNFLTGLGGRDIFVMTTSGGTDTITDFQNRRDLVDFRAVAGIESFADLESYMSQSGRNVVIDLTGEVADLVLVLRKTALADLTADDFLF